MDSDQEKPRPRLLGEYLPCSKGSIRIAMQKKRESKLLGKSAKRIGQILLELDMITEEELTIALRQQRADRLGLCPVFSGLNRAELAAIGNQFKEISYEANKQFIFEGEEDPTLYVLVDGQIEVFTHDEANNEIHLAMVKPIEPIGEMGYFQGGIRTASVRTVHPTELLVAPYRSLTHYFEHVPHVAHAFLDVIKRRQAATQEIMQEVENA